MFTVSPQTPIDPKARAAFRFPVRHYSITFPFPAEALLPLGV
jgi:hypothetical protein